MKRSYMYEVRCERFHEGAFDEKDARIKAMQFMLILQTESAYPLNLCAMIRNIFDGEVKFLQWYVYVESLKKTIELC